MTDETLLERGRRAIEEYAIEAGRRGAALYAVLAELERLRSRVDELEAQSSKAMSARASREMLNRLRKP